MDVAQEQLKILQLSPSVEENRGVSIRRRSSKLDIPQTSFYRILNKDLRFKACKLQLAQQRRDFGDWVPEMHENDPKFHRNIILTDEACVHLDGYANKQNYRFWRSENPTFIIEKTLHSQFLTFSCGLWCDGVIGPYCFYLFYCTLPRDD